MFIQGAGTAERTYDAIVIGSGISGGWAAKELTEQGLKTLVLELRLNMVPEDKLAACGLAVINPPWTFQETMAEALPWLGSALAARATLTSPSSASSPRS